jgi:hypothetical protein
MGAPTAGFSYDNERPRHAVDVPLSGSPGGP